MERGHGRPTLNRLVSRPVERSWVLHALQWPRLKIPAGNTPRSPPLGQEVPAPQGDRGPHHTCLDGCHFALRTFHNYFHLFLMETTTSPIPDMPSTGCISQFERHSEQAMMVISAPVCIIPWWWIFSPSQNRPHSMIGLFEPTICTHMIMGLRGACSR